MWFNILKQVVLVITEYYLMKNDFLNDILYKSSILFLKFVFQVVHHI